MRNCSRPISILFKIVLLIITSLLSISLFSPAIGQADAYDLLLSGSPDRSNPVLLEGETVSGAIYVFTGPDAGVSRVSFYLDDPDMSGSPIRVEGYAPYDFAGTTGDNANPYDTRLLLDGPHEITALIDLDGGGSELHSSTFTVANNAQVNNPFQQNPGTDGLVSIETENFDVNTSQGGHNWTLVSPTGYSGTGAMQALPNSGANNDTGYVTNSPRLDYVVNFVKTGTHYVWLRGIAANGNDDSVHVGLDGVGLTTSDRMSSFNSIWTWSNSTMDGPVATINVTSAGIHTVNVWMREDGFVLDKLVLTTSSGYTPAGTGPTESPRGNSLVFSPNVLTFTVEEGGTTPSQSLGLDTSDGGVTSYTITDDADWLLVTPTSGDTGTQGTLTVSIDATGLSSGTYTGTITATGSGYADGTVDVTLFVTSSGTYDLLLSASPDRSNPVSLEGETVSGAIYVFTGPDAGVSRVSFYLDDPDMSGSPIKVEGYAPYDFAGTTGDNANPFNTIFLFNGSHTITALIELTAGGIEVVNATFTVNNGTTLFLNDDFADGNANGWNPVPDDGQAYIWQVAGAIYQQQESIANPGTFSGSYHLGKYSVYNAGLNWLDYRLSVDITPLAERGDDVGVMFRYQNSDNYYRLSISARYGYTRLEKKVGGVFGSLRTNARGYYLGLPLHIEVEVSGNSIFVYIDGDPVFSIRDSSLRWGGIALYTRAEAQFDNVVVESIDSNPTIAISSPLAYSVTTSDSFQVSALTRNIPGGGLVEFLLDGASCGTSVEDSEGFYTVQCSNLSQDEHSLNATINDGSFEVASDINESVGTSGDNYIAVGDSWTNGRGDTYSLDNISLNGKIISLQGYEAHLSDLLISTDPGPIIIFNEGIGGDESYDAAYTRIDSILDRHSVSNKVLILLGTNDALVPVLSGLGCSGSGCSGTFKENMQVIVNKIVARGKQVFVALVPPVFTSPTPPLNTGTNGRIQEYNSVITSELINIEPEHPDFFTFFLSATVNRYSLFSDELHLNGLGYLVMSHLWHNALSGSTDLPFILENLTPSTVAPFLKQNLIEVGDEYYVDELFTLNSIPSVLENGRWIMTANSDKDSTASTYLSFNADRSVTVYVAYDANAVPPTWLSTGFSPTGSQLITSNPDAPLMDLYESNSARTGDISLGGNLAAGASGALANYIVIVLEN